VYTSEAKAGFLGVQTSQPTSADTAIRLARALPRKDVRVSVVEILDLHANLVVQKAQLQFV